MFNYFKGTETPHGGAPGYHCVPGAGSPIIFVFLFLSLYKCISIYIYIYIYIYGGVSFVWALETDPQHCATQPSGI